MVMPDPKFSYDAGAPPVVACGLSYDNAQVDVMLQGSVKKILQDTAGIDELLQSLSGVASTGFEQEGLQQMLTGDVVPKNWQVGEAIAEAFVADKGGCRFPWPNGRDLKNPKASPAGCDLTGFQPANNDDLPYRFAFGEVKTSEQQQSPPGVMASLGKQLQDLRDERQIKSALCRYLGHHAKRSVWEFMYKSAVKRYLESDMKDVAIYGVLVRDVTAQAADISGCAKALARGCPVQTDIEIYALYLPQNAIGSLSERAQLAIADERAQ